MGNSTFQYFLTLEKFLTVVKYAQLKIFHVIKCTAQ